MYEKLIGDWKAQMPEFPEEADLELGLAIKQIRLRMGLTQEELANDAKIKPAALKTFENGYARSTTLNNLQAIARVLRIPIEEILHEAKEWFSGNFFVQKLDRSTAPGRRKKRREDIWYKIKNNSYAGFRFEILSPPVTSGSHFCFALIEIDPGKQIQGLQLAHPNQIAGFVARGSLKIHYDSKTEFDIFGNQGFILRGDKLHNFSNSDSQNSLLLYVAFTLFPSKKLARFSGKEKSTTTGISIGKAIAAIREIFSDAATRPLTFAEFSYRTGLDEKSLQYLENTTDSDQVIYWDKIEKICHSFHIPLSKFIELAQGKDEGYFHLSTAHDRAFIDYRHYLGVRIKSTLFPSSLNEFHIAEMYIEPKSGIRRVNWKRNDNAMICVYVEDGELRIEVGKNRKATLSKGESVYFDGSLGYIFTNPGLNPAKLLVATHPPIIF